MSLRDAVAAWLRDRFGPDDDSVPDAAYWRDASDLMKFLAANGIHMRTEGTH